jgi:hypothetical protein
MRRCPGLCIIWLLFASLLVCRQALATPNYHLVGWSNTFLPGSGYTELGAYGQGAAQFTYEVGAFVGGYDLSDAAVFTLDGFQAMPPSQRLKRNSEIGIENQLYGNILQEFAIKAHMVNTFEAYRLAAWRGDGLPSDIDEKPISELFLEPYDMKNITDPYVWIPTAGVLIYVLEDYFRTVSGTVGTVSRLTPYSNFLYGFNYGAWQPLGSGAPEEMFFRGFLQTEFMNWTHTPYLAIPMTTVLFAYSHAPTGRLTAAVAGAYLGFLDYHYHGRLGPGITVHFWSDLFLGLETILLNSKGQQSTPPATFSMQIDY